MSVVLNLSPETARHIEEAQTQGVDVDMLIANTLKNALPLPDIYADIDALQAEAKRLHETPGAWRQAFEEREKWLRAQTLPTLQDDSRSRESIYRFIGANGSQPSHA